MGTKPFPILVRGWVWMWVWPRASPALTCPGRETSTRSKSQGHGRGGAYVGVAPPSLFTSHEENTTSVKIETSSSFSQGSDPEGFGRVAATVGGCLGKLLPRLRYHARGAGPQVASDRLLPRSPEDPAQPCACPPGVRTAYCASARTARSSSICMFAPSMRRAQPRRHPLPSTRNHSRSSAPRSPTPRRHRACSSRCSSLSRPPPLPPPGPSCPT